MSGKSSELPDKYTENFLQTLDGRSVIVRALKARLAALMVDLGGHGNLSYQQKSLCKRVVHLEGRIETWEKDLTEGKEIPHGAYFNSINSLIAIYKNLGLYRKSKTIPSLQEFIKVQDAKK